MNIPTLDYIEIQPRTKKTVSMGGRGFPPEQITGVHALSLLKAKQLQMKDFKRKTPIWLLTEKSTDTVVSVSQARPNPHTDEDGNRFWHVNVDGEEQLFDMQTHQMHAWDHIAIPTVLKDFNRPDAELHWPEMALNSKPAERVEQPAQPRVSVQQQLTAPAPPTTPSLFSMEKPNLEEPETAEEELWFGRDNALLNAAYIAAAATDSLEVLRAHEELYADDAFKHTTGRLTKLLSSVQAPERDTSDPEIKHALIVGLNDGQNALALIDRSELAGRKINRVTALQKGNAKGESTRVKRWGQFAYEFNDLIEPDLEGLTDEQVANLAFQQTGITLNVVHRAPSQVNYEELIDTENGIEHFDLVVWDHVENNADLTGRILAKLGSYVAEQS